MMDYLSPRIDEVCDADPGIRCPLCNGNFCECDHTIRDVFMAYQRSLTEIRRLVEELNTALVTSQGGKQEEGRGNEV